MKEIIKYKNGNTDVTLFEDGTKIREYENEPSISFPESIDVKITNYCDMGCLYCHESSTIEGKHADLFLLLDKLFGLPAGVELAIGGGNPLSHPNLIIFLTSLKKRGLIANITINQGHLKRYLPTIEYLIEQELVKGIGISITNNNFKYVEAIQNLSSNIVYHIIAGVTPLSTMDHLIKYENCKVLLLGYKQFGMGIQYYSEEIKRSMIEWKRNIRNYFHKCTLSFDNLAIEQLSIKRHFTTEGWERFFMGEDFTFTMYIDAVKQEFAPTSRSSYREPFNDYSLTEFFSLRNKKHESNTI